LVLKKSSNKINFTSLSPKPDTILKKIKRKVFRFIK